jgi:hypothetical protein
MDMSIGYADESEEEPLGEAGNDGTPASAQAEAPVEMTALLPGTGRELRVSRRRVLGREMWAVAEQDCWPGMVMELRRLSDDMTVMTWEGEVVLFGPDLILRPLPENVAQGGISKVGKLLLYLVEQDVVSDQSLALDRAVVRAASREEACAIAAEWLMQEAHRLEAEFADPEGLFAMELGAADPHDEDRGVVLARSSKE